MLSSDTSSGDDFNLEIDLLGTLRRRWRQILFGLTVGIMLALLYQFSAKKVYEADVEILVGQRSSEMTSSGLASTAAASGDAIEVDQLATHMQLFISRRNIADAIERENLDMVSSIRGAIEKGRNPVDCILNNLSISRGGKGTARDAMVLRASYRDPDAVHAAKILAAIYESYRDYVESHGKSTSKEAKELIDAARQTHEQELVKADEEYRQFIGSVPVLLEGDKVRDIHRDRLENLEKELNEVRSSLAQSSSRLKLIEKYLERPELLNANDTSHLALLSQKEVERLQLFLDMTRGQAQSEAFQAEQPARQEAARAQYTRLLSLLQTERTLAEDFGSNHPMVAATRKEIEVIQNFVAKNAPTTAQTAPEKLDPQRMLATYTLLLRHDIDELEEREQLLIEDSANELMLAKKVEADFLKGGALKTRLARAQSRYDEVIRRLQELDLTGSYAGFSTDLLASPEVKKEAAWPRFSIVLALGGILGLVLGGSLAVASELFDSTFRDATEMEQSLGTSVIAHIPRIDLKKIEKEVDPKLQMNPSLVAFHAPRGPESEIYRVARTSLMVKMRQSTSQSIMMTSPNPGDGKSTTISNLAISLAQVGKRVLLIDADLRRPVIAGMFGLPAVPGLVDVLLETSELAQCLHPSRATNLTIMPHGSRTSEPAELLESYRLSALLAMCTQQFDLVLVDAPPLLAVADPAIIAPQVDQVILTVRIRKNGRRPVERAVKILNEIHSPPAAIIVNASEKSGSNSYKYANGYSSEQYSYVGYYREYAADSESSKQTSVKPLKLPQSTKSARAAEIGTL